MYREPWLCRKLGHRWRTVWEWWSNPKRGQAHQSCRRCPLTRMMYIDPLTKALVSPPDWR